jgi:flagellar FlgN protein
MQKEVSQLQIILQQLITEHDKLLTHLSAQQAAMKKMDLSAIDKLTGLQDATRMRIAALDGKRKTLVTQLALILKLQGTPTLSRLAESIPQYKQSLFSLRDQLKSKVEQVATKSTIAGRVAGALLGHLNTVVRLLAGAVEQAGLYTKQGTPQVSTRIGVMEAVG